ncbi:hypothetical protein KAFR_0E03900 [Kazachstania africana CBS 2517]|uniref:Pre-mRNA-processing factor 17 n=1 Tax=Kazachstania africana (strain ATCC 22294 / BCRC 22015 / CBS 2517 / CECT 1963 / NBRC 1671 / NRRL Y-8276) TaxID=1071382 RepID=H2AVZ1_KAZAF|nr:hypothetical protein KAFR_0E03900 [Kazachstania africana CBS 2517]CCF58541.1 hypothetical protein KAFR_0E03900 [Kazachstania africana CBS 2517]
MVLIEGYSSGSGSSDESIVEEVHAKGSFGSKKRYRFTKQELKARKQQRKSNGPWSAWSSDEDNGSGDKEDSEAESTTVLEEIIGDDNEEEIGNDYMDETSNFYGEDGDLSRLLEVPSDLDIDLKKKPLSFKCYLPKRIKYKFSGHSSGTTCMKFIPNTGHLFLSGGNDNIVKIWDFYHDRKSLRDYRGHTKAIKSMSFNDDAHNFITSSFDQTVKLWDTETGQVKKRLKFKSTPNCVEFRPANNHEFIVGLADSKIAHYDTRESSKHGLVQTYDHHLGSILSLRFFPDGSKFISSSEDKTVRIWENQINIPIKQISDTTQYSMPFIGIHPEHKYFCTQSLDNTIYSYSLRPKYKKHPNKVFKGQKSAGYSIGLSFSPDGRYLLSGDSRSKIVLWDWNTNKSLKDINIPGKKPITQVAWHPQETSKVLCSGPVGAIYMLD